MHIQVHVGRWVYIIKSDIIHCIKTSYVYAYSTCLHDIHVFVNCSLMYCILLGCIKYLLSVLGLRLLQEIGDQEVDLGTVIMKRKGTLAMLTCTCTCIVVF